MEKKRTKQCRASSRISLNSSRRFKCQNYIPNAHKLCDFHLAEKFKLRERYDSEDHEGLSGMYDADDVLVALRQASGL